MANTPVIDSDKKTARGGPNPGQIVLIILAIAGLTFLVANLLRPPETPFTRAVTLIKSNRAAAALPILEQILKEHPNDPTVFPYLAQVYLRTDRIAEGRTALDTALRLKVKETALAPVVLAYGSYYESKGDFEEGEKLYQSAMTACPVNDLAEGRARLYLGWADVDMSHGELARAVSHLEIANSLTDQLGEPVKSLIPHRLCDAYRQLAAVAEVRDENDAKAVQLLERSLAVADEPATRMALASIYGRLHDTDKAIDNYEAVCRADQNNLDARHKLIDLLCEKKDYEKAQVALTDLTDKEKSVENYQLLATVDLKLGNYAGAVRAFEDACDLRPKVELYKQLEDVLNDWSQALMKEHKFEEANSVKGHAERIADEISDMMKDKEDKEAKLADSGNKADAGAPVALGFARIWLAKGSLTPEGEIKIRNTTGQPITDLTLSAVFYDNTARHANGSVVLPVATPQSAPFPADGSRSLYFSCPNIVKADHQLAVIIFYKGRFLKEFPVVKQQ